MVLTYIYLFAYESESEVTQSCPTLCDPMDCSLPGSPSMGFSRQEYWSGMPSPSPINETGAFQKKLQGAPLLFPPYEDTAK